MQAIETCYRGYRFRSRVEARWAVFFDHLGFEFEYEPEGYVLPDGVRYLIDFKITLPNQKIVYCEVKYSEFDDLDPEAIQKLRHFCDGIQQNVVLLPGIPDYRIYNQLIPNQAANSLTGAIFQDYDPYIRIADEYWFSLANFDENTGRMAFEFDDRRAGKAFGKNLVKAVNAAKSARFEHGESP